MADMDKKYRGVVIGCGRIGATFDIDSGLVKPASHAAALQQNPRTELVGLVDPDPAQLKRAGEQYQVATYSDARECLEATKPDVVVIATPPETHEALLALALELRVPAVICEKPVSDTVESAQRMLKAAAASSSIVVLNHQRRFFPLFREARERIAGGELGRIQQVTGYYTNGILNNGSHLVDAIHFLLDDTAVWAMGVQNTLNTAAPFGPNVDGLVGFSKGAVAAVQSLDNNSYGAHELQIFGTRGALLIRQYGFSFEYVPAKEGVTFVGAKELDWAHAETKFESRSMVEATLVHAIEVLDGQTKPQSTLEDGYKVMQVLGGLVLSAAAGGKKIVLEKSVH